MAKTIRESGIPKLSDLNKEESEALANVLYKAGYRHKGMLIRGFVQKLFSKQTVCHCNLIYIQTLIAEIESIAKEYNINIEIKH